MYTLTWVYIILILIKQREAFTLHMWTWNYVLLKV